MCIGSYADISIHTPARGATSFTTALSMYLTISIHAPARGATATCIIPYGAKDISIHAPARGATGKTLCYLIYQIFQSTLPREERPISPRMFPNAFYFNPRSRERSDCNFVNLEIKLFISIHAPARGATLSKCDNIHSRYISIHAPARGATFPWIGMRTEESYFNPRSRERSDDGLQYSVDGAMISIHAPARGATNGNPRLVTFSRFQSTLPREERLRAGRVMLTIT